MDPFTIGSVIAMVETVTSGTISGAASEAGRRAVERLWALAGRARADEDGPPPTLPTTTEERRRLAAELHRLAGGSAEVTRELAALIEEARVAARRPALAVPRMLPAGTRHFTDRERVLTRLRGLLDTAPDAPGGAPTVAALVGPGGVGKSATGLHCAHQLAHLFPDGQLYARLGGASAATATPPAEVLARFLSALAPAEQPRGDLDALAGRFRDLVAGLRLLVLLDDAHSAQQVLPLLPAGPEALVLVTSRYRLGALAVDPGAEIIQLGPLEPADARLLLTRVSGRAAADEASAHGVAAHCGGMPLALCATGSLLREREHLSWAALERRFDEEAGRRASGLSSDGDGDGDGDKEREGPMASQGEADPVWKSTELSYRELSAPAARLMRRAALWPWPALTPPLAARAADLPVPEARAALEELAAVHLLEEFGPERYRFHDLVRQFAVEQAERAESARERAAAVRRAVLWVLGFATDRARRVLPDRWWLGQVINRPPAGPADGRPAGGGGEGPGADAATALAELDTERETLWAAVDAAEQLGLDDLVWQLAEASWPLHLRLGYYERMVATHRRAVEAAVRHAADLGDPMAEGRMLVQLAFAHLRLGQALEAEVALADAELADRRAGHRRGQATALEMLGLLRLSQWRWQEAADRFVAARELVAAISPGEVGHGDVPRALALLDHHLGRALRPVRPHAEVVDQLNAALVALRRLDDGYNVARVYMSLGETHLAAGQLPDARLCLDRAVSAMAAAGAGVQQADALELRAGVARAAGEPAAERADLVAAAELYRAADDERAAARVQARLAQLPTRPHD
ncbi:NB-ARC domain-containing protein [Streptomyces sp. DSM 44915]|uniref:NB-ARC domain-containing protein n=1 Tax=Streptomyces chisholmiae TaxID=3075540 RepID=A0ABU2JTC4_9ACTN|nr:NB-ARC domain-containing protein [Streptomyces sp. DSM 44915]MDT0268240.1 NB-ARC domain-containing protein [Streptomyces sp. DSM 44915]